MSATFRATIACRLQHTSVVHAFGAVISNGCAGYHFSAHQTPFPVQAHFVELPLARKLDRQVNRRASQDGVYLAKELAFRSDQGPTMAPVISTSLISLVITRS